MSATEHQTTPGDILADSGIIHVICCRNESVAVCGHTDPEWYDVDEPPDCVVCLDIEESTVMCPIDGRVCELYPHACSHPSNRGDA